MIHDDRAANRFIEDIKRNLEQEAEGARPQAPIATAHVTINRAVRCTIIVGQAPQPSQRSDRPRRTPGKF